MKRSRTLSKILRYLTALHILEKENEFGSVLCEKTGFGRNMITALLDLENTEDVSYIRKKDLSISRKPQKYYSITTKGMKTLCTLKEQWIIYQSELFFVLDSIQNKTDYISNNKAMISGFQNNNANLMIILQILLYDGPTYPHQIVEFLSRLHLTALQSFDPNEMMRIMFLEGFVEPVPPKELNQIQECNKRRKYWKITDSGMEQLHILKAGWNDQKKHVNSLLNLN